MMAVWAAVGMALTLTLTVILLLKFAFFLSDLDDKTDMYKYRYGKLCEIIDEVRREHKELKAKLENIEASRKKK